MSDFQFTCTFCHKDFDPDPRAVCEGGIHPMLAKESMTEEMFDLTEEVLADMDDEDLLANGITPDQRDSLLRGEPIRTVMIICLECQGEMVDGRKV